MSSIDNPFSLKGEVVVITGGAGMLGQMYAQAVIEAEGIPVLLDIDGVLAAEQAERLGNGAMGLDCDITDPDRIREAHDEVMRRFGRVDALINNAANNSAVIKDAGLRHSSRLETMTLKQWNGDMDVGLTGAFLCARLFGNTMAKAHKGSIVNVSSDLGIISPDQRLYHRNGVPDGEQDIKPVTYSVAKTGLLGLTRYLATYWAKENVRANAICFGGVYDDQPIDFVTRMNERIPMGRMARREEYKGPIVFLCSQASSYMTGATMVVDGGRTIW